MKRILIIITSVFSAIWLLLLSQTTVLAQDPEYHECQNVGVISYTLSTLPGHVTVTDPENLLEPNPAYASFGDLAYNEYAPFDLYFDNTIYPTDVVGAGGMTNTIVISSFFSSRNHGGNLNGFSLIGADGSRFATGYASVMINGGRYQLEDNYDTTPGVEQITISDVLTPVVGVEVALGNSSVLSSGWARSGLWQAAGYCETVQIVYPACTTVADFDFTTPISGAWSVEEGVTIHDGYLDIDQVLGVGNTRQEFDALHRTYTATVYARSQDSSPADLGVTIIDGNGNGLEWLNPVTVTTTVNEDFELYELIVTNTIELGEQAYLFIDSASGVQVDYICLEDVAGVCTNPAPVIYNYNNGLNQWAPVEIADNLSDPQLEPLSALVVSDDDLPPGGYHQRITLYSWDNVISAASAVAGVFLKSPYLTTDYFDTMTGYFEDGLTLYDSIALKAPNLAMLESMSVDIVRSRTLQAINLTVYAKIDGEWTIAGSSQRGYDGDIYRWETDTIDILLQMPSTAVEYAIVSTIAGRPNYPTIAENPNVYISEITTYGCYAGFAYNNECIVSDPDLDGGIDGGPDDYYWTYNNAQSGDGTLTIAAESQSVLYQRVFAETPGNYGLTIDLTSLSDDRCELLARVTTTDGYYTDDLTEDFDNAIIPCSAGTVQQLTTGLTLPAEPFLFVLTAKRGVAEIDNICFGLPGVRCINPNHSFTDGLAGYSGGAVLSSGGILLNPGESMGAIDVPYPSIVSDPGPFILTVEAAPFTNTQVTEGSIPTYVIGPDAIGASPAVDDYHLTISDTSTISYTIETNPENGFGPAVWNWDSPDGQGLRLTSYCIQTGTNTLWYGDKNCHTVTNPDFLEGLAGWDNSSVYNVGGWVKFASGGSVAQTVNPLNLFVNTSMELGTSNYSPISWSGATSAIYSDSSMSHTGSQSIRVETGGTAAGEGILQNVSSSVGTASVGVWLRGESGGEIMRLVYLINGTMWCSGPTITLTDDWQFYHDTIPEDVTTSFRLMIRTASAVAITFYTDDWVFIPGDSIPAPYETPQDTTLHWIGRAPDNTPVDATVTISSTAGVYSSTHEFSGSFVGDQYFDNFDVGGDVEITVTADELFELDYVCLLTGDYDGAGDDGDGPGDGPDDVIEWAENCGSPPMLVISDTLDAWMPTIWPELEAPDNMTTLTAYTAANVRYIACFITGWAQLSNYKLDQIIALLDDIRDQLVIGNILSLLGILVLIVSMLLSSTGEVIETIGALAELLGTATDIASVIGALLLLVPAVLALIALVVLLIRVLMAIGPVFITTFNQALVSTDGVTLIPETADQETLGYIIYGLQVFDSAAGQTYLMPFVVIVIALGSIGLLIWTLNKFGSWTT